MPEGAAAASCREEGGTHLRDGTTCKANQQYLGTPSHSLQTLLKLLTTHQVKDHVHTLGCHCLSQFQVTSGTRKREQVDWLGFHAEDTKHQKSHSAAYAQHGAKLLCNTGFSSSLQSVSIHIS